MPPCCMVSLEKPSEPVSIMLLTMSALHRAAATLTVSLSTMLVTTYRTAMENSVPMLCSSQRWNSDFVWSKIRQRMNSAPVR